MTPEELDELTGPQKRFRRCALWLRAEDERDAVHEEALSMNAEREEEEL